MFDGIVALVVMKDPIEYSTNWTLLVMKILRFRVMVTLVMRNMTAL